MTCHSCIIYFVRQPLTVYRLGIQGAVFVTAVLLLSLRTRLEDGFQIGHVSEILIGIVLIAAQLCIRRVPLLYTETGLAVDHEVSSSILAKMSMNWCKESLQMAGNHGGISLLPALNYATRSRSQPNIQSSCGHLWTQGFTQRRNCFVEQWVLTLARTFLAFGSPYCILQMIRCLEQGTTDNAWAWLFAVGVSSVCDTIVHYQQAWIQWSELGIPIRAQLLHALYRKLLRNGNGHEDQPEKLSTASSKTLPTVTTLMSTDSLGISKFVAVHYIFPLSILKFIIAMVFITRLLGWRGFIVTTLVTVASIPINSSVVRAERLAQRDLRRARDNKDKIASEMLNALRHIKLQATEDLWKTRMKESRSQELKALQRLLLTQNLRAAWKVASPLFVAAASIFTYSYFEGEITASLIFTVLELLPHLQGTLATAPLVIQDYLSAMSHTRRVSSFLGAPDHEMYLEHSRSGDIVVKEASIEWPRGVGSPSTAKCAPPSFELRGVNLDFPSGELSIIHGATGSGKSLLISAILGEARLVEGSIEAPCAQHGSPVGFVAQTPWLQDTSIKDNILFGSPLDPIRYKNVLEACDLMPDLAALPRSDDTLVGVKGVKMSGGQRARIAAARALYSHAQTIILDDVLSALDARVASHVFDALNGPLGKGRTLILATHHIDLCSPRANYIVHVHENTARATDLKAPAVQQHMRPSHKGVHCDPSCVPSRLTTATSTPSSLRHPEKEDEKEPSMKPSPSDRNSGNQWACLRTYLKACGGLQFISSFVVALALKQFSSTIPTWILKDFKTTQSASLDEDPTHNTFQYHARLYGISLLFAVTMEFSFNTLTSTGTMKASTLLFDSMLDKVIHMPLQWLDNVQVGELMQIFSTDSQNVDDKLITTVSDFACCSGEALSIILVG